MTENTDAYTHLIERLDGMQIPYRLIDHEAQGQTELVSALRGNTLEQAAKCMVVMVKIGKKVTKYVLCVVGGDSRVDFNAIKALYGATYVSFASPEIAERLSGSVVGTVLPFSFHPDLELLVDPELLQNEEIYFNAGRLERSMAIKASDYERAAQPRLEKIAARMTG